jgi:hypothetical protein
MAYNKRFKSKLESSLYLDQKFYFEFVDYLAGSGLNVIDGKFPSTSEEQYTITVNGGLATTPEQDYDQIYDGGSV